MNASVRNQYIKSSILSVVSKAIMAVSAIFILFALNKILEKDEFGLFMLAFSGCLLVAMCISGGFRSLILYYVSRGSEKPITGMALFWGGLISTFCALIAWAGSANIANFMSKPGLEIWIVVFSTFIPAYAINMILTSHYRADREVVTMLLFQEMLPAIIKMLFTVWVWFGGISHTWLAAGYVFSYFTPFIILYIWKPIKLEPRLKYVTWWDIHYGFNISLNQVMNKSTSNVMMVLIGYFSNAHAVADFAMALRISQILLIPKMILAQLHVPRIGLRLANDDKKEMMAEYDVVRQSALLMVLLGCLAFVLIGKPVLMLFGDYAQAYPLLLLLAAASLIRAGFGDAGDFLAMTGRPTPILISNIFSFIAMIICFVIFVPLLGSYGVGMAVFAFALAGTASIAASLYKYEKVFVLTPLSGGFMTLGSLTLFLLAAHLSF